MLRCDGDTFQAPPRFLARHLYHSFTTVTKKIDEKRLKNGFAFYQQKSKKPWFYKAF
jgi:hypothetical protein